MYKKEAAAITTILSGMLLEQSLNSKDWFIVLVAVFSLSYWGVTTLITSYKDV